MIARARRGYGAGKRINRTKRRIAVDASACCWLSWSPPRPSRTATPRSRCCGTAPGLASTKVAWANGGYAGKLISCAKSRLALTLEIVKQPDDLHSFKILPARMGGAADLGVDHPQRTIRDCERLPGYHEIHAHWATIFVHDPPPRPPLNAA
jgi:hypothetical protein